MGGGVTGSSKKQNNNEATDVFVCRFSEISGVIIDFQFNEKYYNAVHTEF